MKKKILFLTGGKSDEHEISLISTKCVLDSLDRKIFEPLIVGISKSGIWHFEESTFYLGECRADKISLNENAPKVTLAPYLSPDGKGILKTGAEDVYFDAVFPLLHGPFGEDGTLQGFLDLMAIPYVGPGCGSSWICMDKVLAKQICRYHDIRVADFVSLQHLSEFEHKKGPIRNLGSDLFVKPARLGSSVGISHVTSDHELLPAVRKAFEFDSKCLIEKTIKGREIECAVLGLCQNARASLPGEIIPNEKIGWYSYEAKYLLSDGAKTLAPAPLDEKTAKKIQDFSLKVFNALECDGMARVDLFLERATENIFLNEVNTIPGFTPISMYPKMWEVSGIPYPELITQLIELAFERARNSRKMPTSF